MSKDCRDEISLALRIFILLFIFVLCGIIVWIIIINWHRIELTIRIIGTASEGLARNMRLMLVLPSLIVGLFVYYIPIIVFLVFARLNGRIIPNPKVEESGYACGGSTGVECCLWKEDGWVPAYYALAIITMLWSLTTMIEAQVYIISGTISQWYFCKADSSPPRSIRNSIRYTSLRFLPWLVVFMPDTTCALVSPTIINFQSVYISCLRIIRAWICE